jgi:hypothetical protein
MRDGAQSDETATRLHRALRKEFEAKYARQNQAFKRKDLNGFSQIMAPDLANEGENGGTQTREQWMAQWKDNFADTMAIREVRTNFGPIQLQERNKKAIVPFHYVLDVSLRDRQGNFGPKGKIHKVIIQGHETHTWVQTPKGWLIQHMGSLPGKKNQYIVDGKPFVPPAAPSAK